MIEIESINKILQNPSWDILAIFLFLAIGFIYGIIAGKTKLLAFIFSLYISGFIFENFYYFNRIVRGGTPLERFWFEILIFLLLTIVISILFSKILEPSFDSGPKNWIKSFLLSFSSVGLLFSYLFHIFPAKNIFTFSPMVQNLFASDSAFFWWLFIPLISIFLTRR